MRRDHEEVGIAVIGGLRKKSIVFGDSKKIIREVLPGTIQVILDLKEQDWIKVESFLTPTNFSFLHRFILIDKREEEVIDRFVNVDGSNVPPW